MLIFSLVCAGVGAQIGKKTRKAYQDAKLREYYDAIGANVCAEKLADTTAINLNLPNKGDTPKAKASDMTCNILPCSEYDVLGYVTGLNEIYITPGEQRFFEGVEKWDDPAVAAVLKYVLLRQEARVKLRTKMMEKGWY